jgi:hypothetical protein
MASITTYITSTEANQAYPNDASYTSAQKASALKDSKGLVDSFIDSKYQLPVIGEWDGQTEIEAPIILKVLQKKFYRYLLEFSNVGETEDLKELWDTTVETCRGLRAGELDIPSATYDNEPGWHITNVASTSTLGLVQVRGYEPVDYRLHYKIVITSTGTQYVDSVTYSVYRSDSATARSTGNVASLEWTVVDSRFSIRFDGQWTLNDEIHIVGIPTSDVNTTGTPKNYIQQGVVL